MDEAEKAKQLKDETYNTDVLVIGGGGAGLAAAVSAEQNGAKVIVMEKSVCSAEARTFPKARSTP